MLGSTDVDTPGSRILDHQISLRPSLRYDKLENIAMHRGVESGKGKSEEENIFSEKIHILRLTGLYR